MDQENGQDKSEKNFDLDKVWDEIQEEVKIEEERKRELKGKRCKILRRTGQLLFVLWILIAIFDLAATGLTFIIGFVAVILLFLGGFLS